jgi:putative FmdB family regulatory protein
MPTYEYLCQKCSAVYEERRTFARADEPSRCPECGSPRVQRQLSSVILLSLSGAGGGGGGCACSAGGTCACQANSTRH